ncbi:MAG TPA: PilN domain-containing protein [Thermoanaerobacterales bacterium]|nr:PilN domain-containing protein [Thermoanaerobacterales bacterium]
MKEINLLPEEYIKKRKSKTRKYIGIAITVLIVVSSITLVVGIKTRLEQFKTKSAAVNKIYIEDLAPLIQEKQKLEAIESDINNKYNIYLKLAEEKILWSEILLEIAEIVPKNVQVNNIFLNSEENLIISGQTPSSTAIAQFIIDLNRSPYFNNTDLKFITAKTGSEISSAGTMNYQLILSLNKKGGKQFD